MTRQKPVLLTLLIILALFLAGYYGPFAETIRMTFFSFSKPVFSVGAVVREDLVRVFDGAKSLFSFLRENEELKKKLEAQEKELASLRDEEDENVRLRTALDLKSKTEYGTIAAFVISRDMTHLSHWALLDKGKKQALRREMPVVNHAGLLGKIVETGPGTSRLMLLTDLESRVCALVERTRDAGLVMGNGSLLLEMKFIDLDSGVKVGDNVVTAGLGDVYPKGILIGKVDSLARDRKQMHLVAQVRPAVSFSRIEEVLCLDYRPQS